MVIWETEGTNAQGLQDALAATTKAGRIKAIPLIPRRHSRLVANRLVLYQRG
jgi:hypothetical protein